MKKLFTTQLLLFCLINSSIAQNDSISDNGKRKFFYGTFGLSTGYLSFSETDKIIPLIKNSEGNSLKKEFENYSNKNYNETVDAGTRFNFGLGLKLWEKKSGWFKRSLVRIGIIYTANNLLNSHFYNDTLVFVGVYNSTNPDLPSYAVYKDDYEGMSMSYNVHCLMLTSNQLFYTSDKKWLSFYFGYGITAGHSIQSDVFVQKTWSSRYVDESDEIVFNYSSSNSYLFEISQYKAMGCIMGSFDIPLGVQFRFGKKKKVLKDFYLGAEVHGNYNYVVIPGLGFRSKPGFSLVFPMLRYNF